MEDTKSPDDTKSPTLSMESSGDTSRLLKELVDLQKSTASSRASIDRSLNMQDSHERMQTLPEMIQNSGAGPDPTLMELMKTMYNGNAPGQLILLQGTDTANSFSVYDQHVDIMCSKQNVTNKSLTGSIGSNKVKITPVVNYDWDHKRYIGNLVAVHRSNMFMAYTLKGANGGVVRVTNRKTAERHLMKNFVGRVIDLAFALVDDILLALVDEIGNLFVYDIRETEDLKIKSTVLLQVQRPATAPMSEYHRVIWCPYISDEVYNSSTTDSSNQDSASRLLAVTNDEKAEIWSIDMVTKEYGSKPLNSYDVKTGLIQINSHTKPIMDAAFSPDGTALATASLDGEVKFFQVYMHEKTSPRCLHQWKPHGGEPISCLFFLDDHKNCSPDAQFWKFAVTGANNNQEIKIWGCESWNCLQTIRFLCPPDLPSNLSIEPCMKACMDLSARFIVLSDIKRSVLYVCQIHQDHEQNQARVSSVSEFILAHSCLSFAILDAGTKRFEKSTGDDSHLDEITTGEIDKEDDDDKERKSKESISSLGVQIKLYTVHPKSLQELLIRFKPESSVPQPSPPSVSSISQSEAGMLLDGLSDMSVEGNSEHEESNSFLVAMSETLPGQPVLLTPDAFTSNTRKHYLDDNLRGSMSSSSSFTQVSAMNEDFLSPRSSTGSTITQTPTTPKHVSQSPSSIPLPPVTNSEENDLATPTSARESLCKDLNSTLNATKEVDDFFQHPEKDLKVSLLNTNDIYSSAESSISKKAVGCYDEMDEEVAEVMGDVHRSYLDGTPEGTQPFEERLVDLQMNDSAESGVRSWPKPPDVGISSQRTHTDVTLESMQDDDATENAEGDNDSDDDHLVINDNVMNKEHIEVHGDDDDQTENADGEDDSVDDDANVVTENPDGDDDSVDDDANAMIEKGVHEGDDEDKDDEDDDGEKDEEIEEEIEETEEDIEEQEPLVESIESKRGPMAAPVAGSAYSAPRTNRPMKVREIHKEIIREVIDKKEMHKIHSSMAKILQAVQSQQQQLNQLERNLAEHQENYMELHRHQLELEQLHQVAEGKQPSIEEHLGKLENIVTSRVERLFSQHSQRENQRVHEILHQAEERDDRKHERLCSQLTQTLTNSVNSTLEKLVINNVVPTVTKVLEPVKEQFHREVAQKLTTTESLLKDNIAKMFRSQNTVQAIGMAAGNALHTPIQACYREAFQNIIPAFERATQNMYQQVTDSFQRGTKDYAQQLESHFGIIQQKYMENRDPLISELRKLTDAFETSAEQMQSHVLATVKTQVSNEIQKSLPSLQDNTIQFVREAVKQELATAMQETRTSINDSIMNAMSRAATPMRFTPDPQLEKAYIMNLLQQGQLNAAFQQALSAANLELVMSLCEAVNPSQVFNQTPCPLQQPVLLSLIQQLAAELENQTELKHKYLKQAVMNLDPQDSVTQEHMKGVLYTLNQKLRLYIPAHPKDKVTKSLRILLMASESLI